MGCTTAVLYIPGGTPVDYRNINYVNNQTGPLVTPTNYAPYGITPTVASGLTAAGTTQATALALAAIENIVTTAASGSGVVLQAVAIGTQIRGRNRASWRWLSIRPRAGRLRRLRQMRHIAWQLALRPALPRTHPRIGIKASPLNTSGSVTRSALLFIHS